jgi:hypothetical protein
MRCSAALSLDRCSLYHTELAERNCPTVVLVSCLPALKLLKCFSVSYEFFHNALFQTSPHGYILQYIPVSHRA